jgi:glycine hydroxymethyltransferase
MSIESEVCKMTDLINAHREWRCECWNLIASENTPSAEVEALLANPLSHRYGDYEGIDLSARKYRGNRFIVEIERCAQQAAAALFGARFAELRPLSGHIAGIAPMMALCKPGDAIVELEREAGGHRLAGKFVNCPLVQLRTLKLPFDGAAFNVDLKRTLEMIEKERPRILILGSSCFLFPLPLAALRSGIQALGLDTIIQYDASHVLGLVAANTFQRPLEEGADLITSSTHKTLGGPQGGLILTNDSMLADKTGRAVQPGIQANHHLQRMPALYQTFVEWSGKRASEGSLIIATARALAAELDRLGVPMVAKELGYTASHTLLVYAKPLGDAAALANALEQANIIAGSCQLPAPWGPAGLRLGTQEFVRQGLTVDDVPQVASVIAAVLKGQIDSETARDRVKEFVAMLTARRGWRE